MIKINKKKLFLDFDGVICNTIKTIVNLYSEDFKYYKKFEPIDWSQIKTWGFTELKASTPEYIDHYFNHPRFFANIELMPWAKEVIDKLKDIYDITIVSSGYSPNLRCKEEWIKTNLPFCKFIGVNFKEYSDKSHIDMSDEGSVFIDDSMSNLVTSNAYLKICFGDVYEWNNEWTGIRCVNWCDVWSLFEKLN